MIFRPAGVQSVLLCMYVVSFVKRARVLKRSSTPRLPDLCRPHAQRTKRLQEALCRLGLKMGGQAGADTGQEQGLSGSRDTSLRLVRRCKQSAPSSPRVIGLDDWAHKRRLRYGTLICDLERHRPIDLLDVKRDYFMIY